MRAPVLVATLLAVPALAGCLAKQFGECEPSTTGDLPLEVRVVRDRTNASLPGAWVYAFEARDFKAEGETACSGPTDADGRATVSVGAGVWRVFALKSDEADPECGTSAFRYVGMPGHETLEVRVLDGPVVCPRD